jgi:hypothetical protein
MGVSVPDGDPVGVGKKKSETVGVSVSVSDPCSDGGLFVAMPLSRK